MLSIPTWIMSGRSERKKWPGNWAHKLQAFIAKEATLQKLFTLCPLLSLAVRNAIFSAGPAQIGQYNECSFHYGRRRYVQRGSGDASVRRTTGIRHEEKEVRLEVILLPGSAPG